MTKEIKKYFQKIGRKGGAVRSERKSNACRENGKRGGRPKKKTQGVLCKE